MSIITADIIIAASKVCTDFDAACLTWDEYRILKTAGYCAKLFCVKQSCPYM